MSAPAEAVETPRRIQLSRKKGWRMPENTVKVDRTTYWGNPFVVRKEPSKMLDAATNQWRAWWSVYDTEDTPWSRMQYFFEAAEARAYAVKAFRDHVASDLSLDRLQGKNLACWCADNCHADVLLELANQPSPQLDREGG